MTSYEALYGRRYKTPVCGEKNWRHEIDWPRIGTNYHWESEGYKGKNEAAQDKKKSYANN